MEQEKCLKYQCPLLHLLPSGQIYLSLHCPYVWKFGKFIFFIRQAASHVPLDWHGTKQHSDFIFMFYMQIHIWAFLHVSPISSSLFLSVLCSERKRVLKSTLMDF